MSISGGPNIIKNGLVLYLDAADDSSYVSGSTVWKDISGNSNNYSASLINGPVFTTSSKGMINFDGNNDYALLPVNFFDFDTGDPFTVSIWFNAVSGSKGVIFGNADTSSLQNATGWIPALYIGSHGKLNVSCFWDGNSVSTISSSFIVNDGKFHNVVVSFYSSSQATYFDGNFDSFIKKSQVSYSSIYYYFLGSGKTALWPNTTNDYFSGSLNNFMFFNRSLNRNEVKQLYVSMKDRYGVRDSISFVEYTGLLLHLDAGNTSSYTEGSNTWYDLSGRGNHAALLNSPSYSSTEGSGSIIFDGINDYASGSNTISANLIGDLTVEAWFKIAKIQSDWVRIVGIGEGASRQFGLWFSSGGVSLYQRFGYNNADVSGTTLSINNWYHMVGTSNGTSHKLYLNGTLISSATAGSEFWMNSQPCTIGYAGYHSYFSGSISTVKVYNYGMTATEVSQSFNSTKGRYNL